MNDPQVDTSINGRTLSPSSSTTANRVVIMINTKFDEILENPNTGLRTPTGRSSSLFPPLLIYFDLRTSDPRDIEQLLGDKLASHRWLCSDLASDISTSANELGFGLNRFTLTVNVAITYQDVVVVSDHVLPDEEGLSLKAMRVVLLGQMGREEIEGLKTESCSICLDDLSDSSSSKRGVATRMNCSHLFHGRCLLEWLQRKNTCPLCRTVLYDR